MIHLLSLKYYCSWFAKVVLFLGLILVSFFLPNSFFIVYAWCSRIVSIVFLLVQILILLDGAYNLHEWFLRKAIAVRLLYFHSII